MFDGPSYVFLSFFCYISRAHVTGCLCLTGHRMSFFHFSVILVELMLLTGHRCLCLTVFDGHRMSFFHFSVILVELMLLVVCV